MAIFKPITVEYAAGFFDGEGSVGLYINKGSPDIRYKKGKRGPCWIRTVIIAGCYKPTLLAMQKTFGGRVCRHNSKVRKKFKAHWHWSIGSKKDIGAFLSTVLPFLREKRKQAELMLSVLYDNTAHKQAAKELKRLKQQEWL